MTIPYWIGDARTSDAWNHCLLGEVELPGIVEVTIEYSVDVDVQRPKGSDGAFTVDEGVEPKPVSIEVTLPNRTAWEAWQIAYPKLVARTAGKKREPLEIRHPECRLMGVNSVYIKKIKGPPPIEQAFQPTGADALDAVFEDDNFFLDLEPPTQF